MEYLTEILWLCVWVIVVYLGWKLSFKNVLKFEEKIKK